MREIFDKVGLATKKERVGVGKRRGMEKGAKKNWRENILLFSA